MAYHTQSRPLNDPKSTQSAVADLRPLGLGYVGVRKSPFDSPSIGFSYQLYSDTYGLSLTGFELFSWFQKRFRPYAPGTLDDQFCSRSYRFVK